MNRFGMYETPDFDYLCSTVIPPHEDLDDVECLPTQHEEQSNA